ncbi:hypothetical protein FQR65_LT20186 [Abscondita terminalis]|nr:hypothetical protein FQR65_LT20186 [Abscondita terminalis]
MKEMGLFGCTTMLNMEALGLSTRHVRQDHLSVCPPFGMSISGIINRHLIMAMAVQRYGTMNKQVLASFLQQARLRAGLMAAKMWINQQQCTANCLALLSKPIPHAQPATPSMSPVNRGKKARIHRFENYRVASDWFWLGGVEGRGLQQVLAWRSGGGAHQTWLPRGLGLAQAALDEAGAYAQVAQRPSSYRQQRRRFRLQAG